MPYYGPMYSFQKKFALHSLTESNYNLLYFNIISAFKLVNLYTINKFFPCELLHTLSSNYLLS